VTNFVRKCINKFKLQSDSFNSGNPVLHKENYGRLVLGDSLQLKN
jgi:hypothetical protein